MAMVKYRFDKNLTIQTLAYKLSASERKFGALQALETGPDFTTAIFSKSVPPEGDLVVVAGLTNAFPDAEIVLDGMCFIAGMQTSVSIFRNRITGVSRPPKSGKRGIG